MKKKSSFEGLSAEEIAAKVEHDIKAEARKWAKKHRKKVTERGKLSAATSAAALYLRDHHELFFRDSHEETIAGDIAWFARMYCISEQSLTDTSRLVVVRLLQKLVGNIAMLAGHVSTSLDTIMERNIAKLQARHSSGATTANGGTFNPHYQSDSVSHLTQTERSNEHDRLVWKRNISTGETR